MPSERSRLELGPERMRELGYRTVDALVEWLADDSQPLLRRGGLALQPVGICLATEAAAKIDTPDAK